MKSRILVGKMHSAALQCILKVKKIKKKWGGVGGGEVVCFPLVAALRKYDSSYILSSFPNKLEVVVPPKCFALLWD